VLGTSARVTATAIVRQSQYRSKTQNNLSRLTNVLIGLKKYPIYPESLRFCFTPKIKLLIHLHIG